MNSLIFASNPNGQSTIGKFRPKVDILEVSNDRNSRNNSSTRRITIMVYKTIKMVIAAENSESSGYNLQQEP